MAVTACATQNAWSYHQGGRGRVKRHTHRGHGDMAPAAARGMRVYRHEQQHGRHALTMLIWVRSDHATFDHACGGSHHDRCAWPRFASTASRCAQTEARCAPRTRWTCRVCQYQARVMSSARSKRSLPTAPRVLSEVGAASRMHAAAYPSCHARSNLSACFHVGKPETHATTVHGRPFARRAVPPLRKPLCCAQRTKGWSPTVAPMYVRCFLLPTMR